MKTRHCKLTILCLHIMMQNDQCHASKSCEQLIESVGLLQALQAWSAMREFARKTASEMHISTCKPNMNTCIPAQYFALLTHNVIHTYHFCNAVSQRRSHLFYTDQWHPPFDYSGIFVYIAHIRNIFIPHIWAKYFWEPYGTKLSIILRAE